MRLSNVEISGLVNDYISDNGQSSTARYRSFDYCYTYFQTHKIGSTKDLEKSCLHLAFYLASWGMLRGLLFDKSLKYYEGIVDTIYNFSKSEHRIWDTNVVDYSIENAILINRLYNEILKACQNKATPTHVTKIMLGVFGNTPALDRYFCAGLKISSYTKGKDWFLEKALPKIEEFYENNKLEIDEQQKKIPCFTFSNDIKSIQYPKAKIIDMIGFQKGIKEENERNLSKPIA